MTPGNWGRVGRVMWVWVFLGIGLVGLVSVVCWGIWLWHKAQDVFSEVEMLSTRAQELSDLIAQLEMPGSQVHNDRAPVSR